MIGPAVLLGIALAWLAFVVLHRLLSGRFWLWLLPDLVPPATYLAVPVLLLAVAVPAGQLWSAGAALAALAVGSGHSGLNRGGLARAAEPPAGAVRVLSWNTEYWDQADTAKGLWEFLKSKDADIYVLQEHLHGSHWHPRPAPDLPRLRAEFPGHHLAVAGELLTLSRFPIVGTAALGSAAGAPWRHAYDSTKVLRTDVRIGTAVLSVYNVHIPAQFLGEDNPLAAGFYAGLRDRNRKRRAQFEKLHAELAVNPNPVLVSGDFNSTGAMGDLRWLFRHLTSANHAARRLWPASWPARGPGLWQLDWTFTRGVRVHTYELLDPQGISDHRTQELLISLSGGTDHDRPQAPAEVSARVHQRGGPS
jgi:endonuclease/exonuclease/phosphatase (EEP) superfamily protein YafD